MDRTLWPTLLLLTAVFVLFESTGLDLWLQDHFYDFSNHAWLVSKNATIPRLIFYTGPKTLLFCLGTALLALTVFHDRFNTRILPARRDLMIVVLTLAVAPSLVSLCKATTDVYCPYQIKRYHGTVDYHKVCEPYPESAHPAGHGRGFPAGHASGGFALVSLAGLYQSRRSKLAGFLLGQSAGWAMGGYQMLRGAHYLSHTLITCLLCWALFLILRRLLPSHTPNLCLKYGESTL